MLGTPGLRGSDGRVGMMGISFGGGLSIVAAGRPSIRDRVAFVMALRRARRSAADADVTCARASSRTARRAPRTTTASRSSCSAPPITSSPPRRWPRCAPRSSRSWRRPGSTWWTRRPPRRSSRARRRSRRRSTSRHARYMGYVNARDVARLGPVLLPFMAELGGDPALSPARSPLPAAPGLPAPRHGRQRRPRDRVDAAGPRPRQGPPHGPSSCVTPLITHAEVDRASTARAAWSLIDFWARLLDE